MKSRPAAWKRRNGRAKIGLSQFWSAYLS